MELINTQELKKINGNRKSSVQSPEITEGDNSLC